RRSWDISVGRANGRSRARRCCRRCGAIIPASPPTRWRRTSIGCGRRSRRTPPALPSWSPKRAVTNWCRNAAPMAIDDDIAFLERVPTLGLLGRPALRILAIGAETRHVHGGGGLVNAGDAGAGGFGGQAGRFQLSSSAG